MSPSSRILTQGELATVNEIGRTIGMLLIRSSGNRADVWKEQVHDHYLELDHLENQCKLGKGDPRKRGLALLALLEKQKNVAWETLVAEKLLYLEPSCHILREFVDAVNAVMSSEDAPDNTTDMVKLVWKRCPELEKVMEPKPILSVDRHDVLKQICERKHRPLPMLVDKMKKRKRDSFDCPPWLARINELYDLKISADSGCMLGEAAGASLVARLTRLTATQSCVLKRALHARANGYRIVTIEAPPAAGKTEILTLLQALTVLRKGSKHRNGVLMCSVLKSAVNEARERIDKIGLRVDHPTVYTASGQTYTGVVKCQSICSYAYRVVGNSLGAPPRFMSGPKSVSAAKSGSRDDIMTNAERQRVRQLRSKGEEIDDTTGMPLPPLATDPELEMAVRVVETRIDPCHALFRVFRRCFSKCVQEYFPDLVPMRTMRDIGRLFMRIVDSSADDDEDSELCSAVAACDPLLLNLLIVNLEKDESVCMGVPKHCMQRYTAFSEDPKNQAVTESYAFRVLTKLRSRVGSVAGANIIRTALEVIDIRKAALQSVTNGVDLSRITADSSDEDVFNPRYEDFVDEKSVEKAGVSCNDMVLMLQLYDHQLLKHGIDPSVVQFVAYDAIGKSADRPLRIDGNALKMGDEAQTFGRSHLDAFLRSAELTKSDDDCIFVFAGQQEQAVLGFTGACGDFVDYICNNYPHQDHVLNLRLNENFASTQRIVGVYNMIVPHCGTEDPVRMLASRAEKGHRVRVVRNTLDRKKEQKTRRREGEEDVTYWSLVTPYDTQLNRQIAREAVAMVEEDPSCDEITVLTRKQHSLDDIKAEFDKCFYESALTRTRTNSVKLSCSTMHSSLGTRNKRVIVAGITCGHYKLGGDGFLTRKAKEELNLLMVACSRPEQRLTVIYNEYSDVEPADNFFLRIFRSPSDNHSMVEGPFFIQYVDMYQR